MGYLYHATVAKRTHRETDAFVRTRYKREVSVVVFIRMIGAPLNGMFRVAEWCSVHVGGKIFVGCVGIGYLQIYPILIISKLHLYGTKMFPQFE